VAGETILVIDTDTETVNQIVSTLESEDYLVFTAPNGDVGIAMAKKVNPSLIFINPAMTGSSGLEVCKTIHNTGTLDNVPIVVISSFEGAVNPRYAALYGIVDSLKKPFNPEDIVSKTRDVLSMKDVNALSPVEDDTKIGEMDETMIMDQTKIMTNQAMMPEIEKDTTEKLDVFDKTAVMMEEKTGEFSDKTASEEDYTGKSEEALRKEHGRTYTLKNIRRRGMGSRLFVPLIVVAAIVVVSAAGVGLILYKEDLLPWLKVQTTAVVKPSQPVQQGAEKTAPSQPPQAEQKPIDKTMEKKPVTQSPAPSASAKPKAVPAPKAPSKAAIKTPAKAVYSVQIGAFMNSANAEALAKQYKGKGYDAFVQKGMKDKGTIYRVLIGKFESRKAAAKQAESIRSKEKTGAVIFKG